MRNPHEAYYKLTDTVYNFLNFITRYTNLFISIKWRHQCKKITSTDIYSLVKKFNSLLYKYLLYTAQTVLGNMPIRKEAPWKNRWKKRRKTPRNMFLRKNAPWKITPIFAPEDFVNQENSPLFWHLTHSKTRV